MKKLYTFINTKLGQITLFLLTFLFLFTLELNFVGLSFRDKIIIGSTLDFSWFSDLIERLLHGYVLGRDFTFTYGPLFQFIYSLPSIIFHVPSYISVALSPIISFVIIFLLIFYIAQNISNDVFERVSYILFVFIILGLLITSSTDTIKALIPLAYSVFLFNLLNRKFNLLKVIIVSVLPTIFGLYAYNLFFTCCLITVLLLVFLVAVNSHDKNVYKFLLIVPLIVVFQIIFSFLLTQNFDYIRYSLDSIANYRYVLDLPWTHDRDNILLLFPLLIISMGVYLWKTNYIPVQKRNILFILIFASLIQLDYAVSRSDAGHLLWSFFPSIITFFSIVYVLGTKARILFPLAFIFYILVPYKPTFYNTLAPKNILTVLEIIHQKPDFFSIYTLPDNYYFSENDLKKITQFADSQKNNVFIYPYDSYILNSVNTTYNSYALGIYVYSDSAVETNTVHDFSENPPPYIILMIDTKGALNLDDIPNFTRNPQLALWMIKNYSVLENDKKYLILSYSPKKKTSTNSCQVIQFTANVTKKESVFQKGEDLIKPATYYLGAERLPYFPSVKNYLLFQNIYNSSDVQNLFKPNKKGYSKLPVQYTKGLIITRIDPFTGKKQAKYFSNNEYSVQCLPIK